jgi:hypothetical protein
MQLGFSEADTFESSSILIYHNTEQNIFYTQQGGVMLRRLKKVDAKE